MAKFLRPIAIVGCSVSILFYFATFLVLSCLKKKSFSLRLKQHYTLSLCISYFITVLGLREDPDEVACQFITLILQYTITTSFAWLCIEAYSSHKNRNQQSLPKYFLIAWLIPLPPLVISLIVGLVADSKIGIRYYTECWKSDHVIWLFIIPSTIMVMGTLKYLIPTVLANDRNKDNSSTNLTNTSKDSAQYISRTNLLCLILQVMCWTGWVLVFFYPSERAFHLLFGVVSAVKAALLFFFYAVSYIEIYMENNNTRIEDSMLEYDAVHHGGIELKECSVNNKMDVHPIEPHEEQENDPSQLESFKNEQLQNTNLESISAPPEDKSDDNVNPISFVPDKTKNDESENADVKSINSNVEETTVLVHSPGSPSSLNESKLTKVLSVTDDMTTAKNNDDEERENDNDKNNQNRKNGSDPGSDVETKSLKSTTTTMTDITDVGREEIYDTKPSDVPTSTSPVLSNQESLSLTENKKMTKTPSSNDGLIPDGTTISLSSSNQSSAKRERDTRTSSRASNISFTSQMGMNELESLFNNPDLLNQSNWKARSRSNASPNRMGAQEPSQSHATALQQQQQQQQQRPSSATPKESITEAKQEDEIEGRKIKSPTSSTESIKRKKRDSRNEFFDFN